MRDIRLRFHLRNVINLGNEKGEAGVDARIIQAEEKVLLQLKWHGTFENLREG